MSLLATERRRSSKECLSRFKHTHQRLTQACMEFETGVDNFEKLSSNLMEILDKSRDKSWRLSRRLSHWWQCGLLLKDQELEIFAGEIRYIDLKTAEMPYLNDPLIAHNHEKRFSGEALDDLREALKQLEGRIADHKFQVLDGQYDGISVPLEETKGRLKELVDSIACPRKGKLAAKTSNVVTFLYHDDILKCPAVKLYLKRPPGSAWVESAQRFLCGEGMDSESSEEDESVVFVKPSQKRKQVGDDSDEDPSRGYRTRDEREDEEEEGLDSIKRRVGVDPERMRASFDALRAEEERTARLEPASTIASQPAHQDFNRLGKDAESRGEYQRALEFHRRDLGSVRDPTDYLNKCIARRNMGVCLGQLNEDTSALQCLQCLTQSLEDAEEGLKALAGSLAEERHCEEEEALLAEKERCFTELGNFHLNQYESALEDVEDGEVDGLESVDRQHLTQALSCYQKSFDLSTRLLLVHRGDRPGGSQFGDETKEPRRDSALQDGDQGIYFVAVARAAFNLGRALQCSGRTAQALDNFHVAIHQRQMEQLDHGEPPPSPSSSSSTLSLSGEGAAFIADCYTRSGQCQMGLGQLEQANSSFMQALELSQTSAGEAGADTHSPLSDALYNLAFVNIELAEQCPDLRSHEKFLTKARDYCFRLKDHGTLTDCIPDLLRDIEAVEINWGLAEPTNAALVKEDSIQDEEPSDGEGDSVDANLETNDGESKERERHGTGRRVHFPVPIGVASLSGSLREKVVGSHTPSFPLGPAMPAARFYPQSRSEPTGFLAVSPLRAQKFAHRRSASRRSPAGGERGVTDGLPERPRHCTRNGPGGGKAVNPGSVLPVRCSWQVPLHAQFKRCPLPAGLLPSDMDEAFADFAAL